MVGRGSTMLEWQEIEKILAKLGRTTATLAQKNGVLGRAFGVCLQAPHRSGATVEPPESARVICGPFRVGIWGRDGDALSHDGSQSAPQRTQGSFSFYITSATSSCKRSSRLLQRTSIFRSTTLLYSCSIFLLF